MYFLRVTLTDEKSSLQEAVFVITGLQGGNQIEDLLDGKISGTEVSVKYDSKMNTVTFSESGTISDFI